MAYVILGPTFEVELPIKRLHFIQIVLGAPDALFREIRIQWALQDEDLMKAARVFFQKKMLCLWEREQCQVCVSFKNEFKNVVVSLSIMVAEFTYCHTIREVVVCKFEQIQGSHPIIYQVFHSGIQ